MLTDFVIREWMTPSVITVTPDTPITQAHDIMQRHNIRRLPVVENDRLAGIVTIGDVREASPSGATTLSIWELNYLWSQLQVKNVMTRKVLTVHANEPLINAARIMLEHKVSGLPVVDDEMHVVGIITESDLFRMMVEQAKTEVLAQ
jgi:acetoin utilization protein AcuB